MRKTAILSLATLLCAGLLCLTACDNTNTDTISQSSIQTAPQGDRAFTLDKLAQYDGSDGQPAYVAVDGVVYDVSASRVWPEGTHTICDLGAVAGKDLSTVIEQAPARMRALLKSMPVVGYLDQP